MPENTEKHEVIVLKTPIIKCKCGWKYILEDPADYGHNSAHNKLLDAYLLHRETKKCQ